MHVAWFFFTWWRHQMEPFSALPALCAGNSPVPGNSPHKGQWRGALMFFFSCAWINDWVNNREAGDLRRHRGHYDVNVMVCGWVNSWCTSVTRTRTYASGSFESVLSRYRNISWFFPTMRYHKMTLNGNFVEKLCTPGYLWYNILRV